MRRGLKTLGAVAGVVLVVVIGWGIAAYGTTTDAKAAMVSDARVRVQQDESGAYRFSPLATAKPVPVGLMFFPGGMVSAESYAPLARAVAAAGYPVILVPLPRRGMFGASWVPDALHIALGAIHEDERAVRWVLAGHSLGGYLAPRIASLDEKIAGIVILAGNTRPLEDLILEQYTYLFSLNDPTLEKDKDALADVKKKVARVKAEKLADAASTELPLGVPASYWVWMRAYDPAKTAAKLRQPILVLQGERDYQVTMADLKGWKTALADHKDAKIVAFPDLNHLFMTGKGKGKPAEYAKAGHVSREVVDEIAAWVKKR